MLGGADSDRTVISYDTERPRRNTAALLAVLFGALLFIPFVTGLLAIRSGRRGLRDARDYALGGVGAARAGIRLGVVNLALWTVVLSGYLVHARREAARAQCRDNLRRIGQAMLVYSNDNRGIFPPTWDVLVARGYLPPNPPLKCPHAHGGGDGHYVIGGPWNPPPHPFWGTYPEYLVLACEVPATHPKLGIAALFADGRVETFTHARAIMIDADLRAGLNPPPTLDEAAARQIQWTAATRAAAASRAATSRAAGDAAASRPTIRP